MLNQLKQHIKDRGWLQAGDKLLLACSGGIDSMVMLHLFSGMAEEMNIKLALGHVNHQLRESAKDDERFVRRQATKLGLECYTASADVQKRSDKLGISMEMAARELRYYHLERMRGEIDARYICTAHTKSDQAETVLMRLAHGTGIHGIRGIHEQRDHLLRPLLTFSRSEIQEYAVSHAIDYREDPTNTDVTIERNWIRHKLFPMLRDNLNPRIEEALFRFSAAQSEVSEYLEHQAAEAMESLLLRRSEREIVLDIRGFRDYFTALQKQIIMNSMEELNPSYQSLTYPQMQQLYQILTEGSSGQSIELPNGISVMRSAGRVLFSMEDLSGQKSVDFNPTRQIRFGPCVIHKAETHNVTDQAYTVSNEWEAFFDKAVLMERNLCWRNWKNGDKMVLANGSTKKVSDIWIDNNVPVWEKLRRPLLVEGDKVYWIPGVKRSGFAWITPESDSVIYIKVESVL
ncbi:MAG: tRNA lysidine(34) synthetase TilS [Candidatus Marinimicrobia bacterium]|nr:tRNA lysidine(34) synthetase TilS [Candidatus Neomarinimicrobiota bacterium]MCF7828984.1 tRNA lysidine(34) synthetase TilS [Candidatus Neomarinimicrobiota bacterium]MCF7879944.1 tRNA lysidine(34) synthetase TilS [Candidatus Neomarinimicrobiota bacterium]